MNLKGMPCNIEEFNRFQLCDEAVFHKIFVFYKPFLFRKFNQFCSSHVEVEEVLQEVFVQLFLKRQQIPDIQSIFPFLYIVGKRMSISYFRKAVVREQYMLKNQSQFNEAYDCLETHIETKDLSDILESIIKDLPTGYTGDVDPSAGHTDPSKELFLSPTDDLTILLLFS